MYAIPVFFTLILRRTPLPVEDGLQSLTLLQEEGFFVWDLRRALMSTDMAFYRMKSYGGITPLYHRSELKKISHANQNIQIIYIYIYTHTHTHIYTS